MRKLTMDEGVEAEYIDATINTEGENGTMNNPAESQTDLRRGSKGALVRSLQAQLLAHGYTLPRFGADGDFGAETEAAVKQYQTDHGIYADGICNSQIWSSMTDPMSEDTTSEGTVLADFSTLLDALRALVARYAQYSKGE